MTSFFPPQDLPSGGFFGPRGVTGLTWTRRSGVIADFTALAPPSSSIGITIMDAGPEGDIFVSTDGGHTWTQELTGEGLQGFAAHGAGMQWIFGGTDGQYWISTHNGAVWSGPDTFPAAFGTQNTVSVASSGSPNDYFVVAGNGAGPANYATSTTNGNSFTVPETYTNQSWSSVIWDGTQFVAIAFQETTGLIVVATAATPTGAWTETVIAAGNAPPFTAGLSFDSKSGLYLIGAGSGAAQPYVRTAKTPAGLATAPNVNTGLNGGEGLSYTLAANGLMFAFDLSGGVASSTDGHTWIPGVLNLPFDESAVGACYDSVNKSYIATNGNGAIVTLP